MPAHLDYHQIPFATDSDAGSFTGGVTLCGRSMVSSRSYCVGYYLQRDFCGQWLPLEWNMRRVSERETGVSERSHVLCDFLLNYLFRVRISEGNVDIKTKICGEGEGKLAGFISLIQTIFQNALWKIKPVEVEHTDANTQKDSENDPHLSSVSLNEFLSRIHDGRRHKILIKCSWAPASPAFGC